MCMVDGEANIFNRSLFSLGHHGGKQAAEQLTKGIAEFLSQEDVQVFGRISFWITIFLNRRAVLETLLVNSCCTAEQFDAFWSGFSQASPRFQLVEVGSAKDAVTAKIKGKYTSVDIRQSTSRADASSYVRKFAHVHSFPPNSPGISHRCVESDSSTS